MFRHIAASIVLFCLNIPVQAQPDCGGPDGFGYYYESSQDPNDTVQFSWLDPAGHTLIADWTPDPDDGWARIPLPGGLPFYGDTLDSMVVCTNGFIEHPTTSTNYLNLPLPMHSIPSLIAVFWDDLCPAASGAVLRYDDPAGAFTAVTWRDVVRYGTTETLTCQVILFANGHIRMNYLRVPADSRSCTIGIQGNSGVGNCFLEYVFSGQPVVHVPHDSTSIVFFVRRLENDVGIHQVTSPSGWIPSGRQVPVSATVRNYGMNPATFPVRALVLRKRFPHDTLFDRSLTVTGLTPGDTFHCYFGDFLTSPNLDSWRVVIKTGLPGDQYSPNDTACALASSFPPDFGVVLASWDFPSLGNGLNLAGISFSVDSNRFYLAANDPARVYSFPPAGPTSLREETFELQNFFGDDVIWGIASAGEQRGLWLTHVSEREAGCMLARYNQDGTFAGDTWVISEALPGTWLAGIDCGPDNTLYATSVGAGNHVYHLDPLARTTIGWLGSPTASWRACSWIGDHDFHLLTGGWNNQLMVLLDRRGNITRTAWAPDLADLDVYRPSSPPLDTFVWAYRTRSNDLNTIEKISLGILWSGVGTCEPQPPPPVSSLPLLDVRPSPATGGLVDVNCGITDLPARLELRDVTGRLILMTTASSSHVLLPLTRPDGRRLANGVYLLRLATRSNAVTHKVLVANTN